MAKYSILTAKLDADYCAIYDLPDGMPKIHRPAKGVRMDGDYEDTRFHMAREMPGIAIADMIQNALNYFMVSSRLKAILEKHATAEIEFLKFTLINHRKRVASDDLYIVNLVGTSDCVDRKRTRGDWSPTHPDQYMFIEELHLDPEKVDPRMNLFRIASMPSLILIREDLRSILENEGVTGAEYLGLGEKVRLP